MKTHIHEVPILTFRYKPKTLELYVACGRCPCRRTNIVRRPGEDRYRWFWDDVEIPTAFDSLFSSVGYLRSCRCMKPTIEVRTR